MRDQTIGAPPTFDPARCYQLRHLPSGDVFQGELLGLWLWYPSAGPDFYGFGLARLRYEQAQALIRAAGVPEQSFQIEHFNQAAHAELTWTIGTVIA
jgi:hypothetical protein